MHNARFLFPALLSSFLFMQCSLEKQPDVSNINAYEGYILSHSPDVIATDDPIVFLFDSEALAENAQSFSDDDILTISPKVPGTLKWTDQNVMRYLPADPLAPGKTYVVKLHMQKLIPSLPDSLKTLTHSFKTEPMQVNASFENALQLDPNDNDEMMLGGTVAFNTDVDPEAVRKAVAVEYAAPKQPRIEWKTTDNKKVLEFTISEIVRGDDHRNLSWKLKGRSIGADYDLQYNFRIPPEHVFTVNDLRLERGERTRIQLNFSEHLDRQQDLRGLVRIQGNTNVFTYEIDRNNLLIFPDKGLAGSFELILEDAIKSVSNRPLDKGYVYELTIEKQKPALRLVGNGVIIPGKKQVIFPFEAINLNKVDVEIVKIFQDNILQFLQYNALDNDYNLEAVGRVIRQETIDLTRMEPDIPVDIWTRYAFDLSSIIDLDPGAVYQVRIGFRKEYTLFPCENEAIADTERGSTGLKSFWTYRTNYPGFTYDHYENPCFQAYYNYNHFIKRNVLASYLGITAKSVGKKTIEVYTTHLLDATPASAVDIALYDYQQQLLTKGVTDFEGRVRLTGEREPSFIIATGDTDQAYLRIMDGMALSLSSFDVGGRTITRNFDGFFYAEREVWRPGDTLFLNFILDRKDSGLPDDHPVEFKVYNPQGKEYMQRVVTQNIAGLYAFHFQTKPSDLTGNWHVEAKVGDVSFNELVKIETVRPNRLKILWEGINEVRSYLPEEAIQLTSNWLHGAPASGLKASVNAQITKNHIAFDNSYQTYHFHDPTRSIGLRPVQLFNSSLNADGEASIKVDQFKEGELSGPMNMRLQTRVFEPGAGFSEDHSSGRLFPFSEYVGIQLPRSRWGGTQMAVNEENTVKLVVLDGEGKPVQNRQLLVGLYEADWSWWWDRQDYSMRNFNSGDHQNAYMRDTVVSGPDGMVDWTFKPVSYDNWLLRVCDPVSGHCTGDLFYTGWGNGEQTKEAVSQLRFQADKTEYSIGDMANITVPASKGSMLLITVEKNDTILHSEWQEAKSEEYEYRLKISDDMVPNVYVHVSLMQPHADSKNDLPLRLYGVIPLKVENPKTVLNPVIAMPDELKPNGEFNLTVSEEDGYPMAYTIAIVDEGLLDLTHFKTPDPHSHFYAKQALRVSTWDMYDLVLSNLGGELSRIFSVGGDGAVEVDPGNRDANRFPPVVRHLGPYYLEKGKKATHTVTMPNYVGSVRTMVVACGNGRYGSTDKTTPVRQPLMLLATLPRVLSPGEECDLPVQLFAMKENINHVNITVETDQYLHVSGETKQSLQFTRIGDQTATFRVKVGDKPGVAHVRVSASSGNFSASQDIEIAIENPNPVITKVNDGLAEENSSMSMPLNFFGVEGSHNATLEVSAIPPINLGQKLAYLLGFPYGCAEQTTSKAFVQLFLDRVTDLDDAQKQKVKANTQHALNRLKQFQLHEGGFGYWPTSNSVSLWTTSYVGHYLLEASKAGYYVDQRITDAWVKSQTRIARAFRPGQPERHWSASSWELQHAYRLYTLALAGSPDWGSMNLLRSQITGTTSGWLLAAAYAEAGKPDLASEISNGLSFDFRQYREYGYTYGSEIRDRAIVVNTLMQTNQKTRAADLVRDVAYALGSGQWMNTQELGFAFMAIARFLGSEPLKEHTFEIVFPDGTKQAVVLDAPVLYIDITNEAWDGKEVKINNQSAETLFIRVSMSGKPIEYTSRTENNHLRMSIKFSDTQGRRIDVSRLARGTDVIAQIQITNSGSRLQYLDNIALTQIFPSGWEIHNERLTDYGDFLKNSMMDYRDIRDDRVYTYFDIYSVNNAQTYSVLLTATYPGRYFMPDVYCEAMYDKEVFARGGGGWVEVF